MMHQDFFDVSLLELQANWQQKVQVVTSMSIVVCKPETTETNPWIMTRMMKCTTRENVIVMISPYL